MLDFTIPEVNVYEGKIIGMGTLKENFTTNTLAKFTPEEKELIVNTPITTDSFEKPSFDYDDFSEETLMNQDLIEYDLWVWNHELIRHLERLRKEYLENKDERVFEMLIRLLPNSYKVVKL